MIFQIDQLFINTDKITTISPYDLKKEDKSELGLIINGVKYAIFIVDNKNVEELISSSKKIVSLVNTIVSSMTQCVQRIRMEDNNG